MKLTPQQAANLKDANLGNMIKKLKAGKTLTAAESKMLDAASVTDEGQPVALCTLNKVCDLFSISRRTVSGWRKDGKKGVPEKVGDKEDLAAWRRFFASNPEAGFYDGKPRQDRETLLCHKLEVEIELKKIQLAESEGRVISRADVHMRDTRIGSAVAAAMRALETELPQLLLGLPLERGRPITKEKTRAIQAMLADELSEFWKEHPEK
jgi:hypothetical protein